MCGSCFGYGFASKSDNAGACPLMKSWTPAECRLPREHHLNTSRTSPDHQPISSLCRMPLPQVRLCPETNHEELVVITGSNPTVAASAGGMLPYVLDLTTFAWRDGPWRRLGAHVLVPGARQRPGSTRVAGKWLLMSEGSPLPVRPPKSLLPSHAFLPSCTCSCGLWDCSILRRTLKAHAWSRNHGQRLLLRASEHRMPTLPALRMQIGVGTLMEDVHRLHLPSLTWRGPLPLHPDSGAVRHTAGHSATGLVSRCSRV